MDHAQGRPSMGIGSLEPVKPQQDRRRALGRREDGEIRRPATKGSRADLEPAVLEQSTIELHTMCSTRIGVDDPRLCVEREGVQLGDDDPQAFDLLELSALEIERAESNTCDRGCDVGRAPCQVAEHIAKVGATALIEEYRG